MEKLSTAEERVDDGGRPGVGPPQPCGHCHVDLEADGHAGGLTLVADLRRPIGQEGSGGSEVDVDVERGRQFR